MKIVANFLVSLLVSAAFLGQTMGDAKAAGDPWSINEALGEGINISNWAIADGTGPVQIESKHFAALRAAGFDSVRIFMDFVGRSQSSSPWKISDSYMARAKQYVDWALNENLAVVIGVYRNKAFLENPQGELNRFRAIWDQIAKQFQNYPDTVVFELLNEPKWPLDRNEWNNSFPPLIDQIRQSNPDRTIFVSAAGAGMADRVPDLELPSGENNLIVTFHMYEPFEFTHSGCWWCSTSYPEGAKWAGTDAQKAELRAWLDHASDYQAANNVPVNMGEWGVMKKADSASRSRWFDFVRTEAEQRGFSTHYWAMLDGAFGLYDWDNGTWDNSISLPVDRQVADAPDGGGDTTEPPQNEEPNDGGDTIAGHFLVQLKASAGDPEVLAVEMAETYNLTVDHVYTKAIKGFSADVPTASLDPLSQDSRVVRVEEDQVVQKASATVPTGIQRIFAAENPLLSINGEEDVVIDADVAVIDTGIDHDHPDLNVVGRVDCSGGSCLSGGTDIDGHGTHMAGIIGARDNDFGVVGVAPGVRLWAVKVLEDNAEGTLSSLIAGLDWVVERAADIEVANLSVECQCNSFALEAAIAGAVDAGIVVTVPVGNGSTDASGQSPANHPDVIGVSAVADYDGLPGGLADQTCRAGTDDALAPFSNYGTPAAVAAPGMCIHSTHANGGYATMSGTSQASAHVAGAAAILASGEGKPLDRAGVEDIAWIIETSGNFDWNDTSGDSVKEPLLDVSTFMPSESSGSPPISENSAPILTVSAPTDGAVFSEGEEVMLEASADDVEDGDLTGDIIWTSSLDGNLGNGGSLPISLSVGEHVITASVQDSEGVTATESASLAIESIATAPVSEPELVIGDVQCELKGGRRSNRHLFMTVPVNDDTGQLVEFATLRVEITHNGSGFWSETQSTGSDGVATFKITNAPVGDFELAVQEVRDTSLAWDGTQPPSATCTKEGNVVSAASVDGSKSTKSSKKKKRKKANTRRKEVSGNRSYTISVRGENVVRRNIDAR